MRLFFGVGTDRPVSVCTDIRDYLSEDKRYHYKDGFSMAEAAKCWVAANGYLPPAIACVVGGNALIAAHFEYPTGVWGGGTAMTDIMAFVPNGVVAVEAKVNEPFDDLVSSWIFRDEKKNFDSPPHRTTVVQQYAKAFGVKSEQLLNIRYQLLQRTLSAALTAHTRRESNAWMIVQAFLPGTGDGHRSNKCDFDRYVDLVGVAPEIEGVRVQLAWVAEPLRS